MIKLYLLIIIMIRSAGNECHQVLIIYIYQSLIRTHLEVASDIQTVEYDWLTITDTSENIRNELVML